MLYNFTYTTSARDVQRHYRKLFDTVRATKQPLVVMRRNRPDVAIVDVKYLEELEAVGSVMRSLKEVRQGKAKRLRSLANLS